MRVSLHHLGIPQKGPASTAHGEFPGRDGDGEMQERWRLETGESVDPRPPALKDSQCSNPGARVADPHKSVNSGLEKLVG